MAPIYVSQILFENGVCGVKWQNFSNKTVNKSNTVADPELIFGKLIVLDEMKPV